MITVESTNIEDWKNAWRELSEENERLKTMYDSLLDRRNLDVRRLNEARRLAEKYYMYANSGTFPSWQDEGVPWSKDND